jgi:hypothetical protein
MEKVNQSIYDFFERHLKPASIGLVGASDITGISIRNAQKPLTADGRGSLWSHSFLFGGYRLDRHGPSGSPRRSPYVFESDLKVSLQPVLRNGAQESWLGKWCGPKIDHAAVINLGLSEAEQAMILATALQFVDDQVLYPIEELLGTWWAIITHQEWKPNPFDSPHAMYCSTFVRHCYREAGRDVAASEVHPSNTAPEHIARFCREQIVIWDKD